MASRVAGAHTELSRSGGGAGAFVGDDMGMSSWWWFLTRSTGIVAAALSVTSLAWGFFFTSRTMGSRLRANWWLSLHKWLGGMTLSFVAVHTVMAWLDEAQALRLVDLVVPSGEVGWSIGYGVVAAWLFALVVLPSVARIRRRLPRRLWRAVHLLAVPAVVLTGIHTALAGTDITSQLFILGFSALVAFAVFTLTIRVLGLGASSRRQSAAA